MAKFIINDLLYDTDKMEHVANIQKGYTIERNIFGENIGRMYDCKLYKSKKGRFALIGKINRGETICRAITETEGKQLWQQYNYETYAKCYGELEEA